MLGIAMLTMVKSSRVIKNPSETTSSTSHGFPAYFRTVSSPILSQPDGCFLHSRAAVLVLAGRPFLSKRRVCAPAPQPAVSRAPPAHGASAEVTARCHGLRRARHSHLPG